MDEGFFIKIEGLQDLERNLNKLSEDVSKKAVVAAARAGAAVLLRAQRARAAATFKTRTGRLLRGLRTQMEIKGRGVKGAVVKIFIGVTGREKKDSPFYARFQELGYHAIGHGSGRRRRHRISLRRGGGFGKIYKHPFMGPAFEDSAASALSAVIAKLKEFFDK